MDETANLAGAPEAGPTPPPAEEDGWDWMLVEIFGHRSHWGRGKEVERFGAKMLRIDVPQVEWSEPTAEQPASVPLVKGWVTHFYGGAAIFSQTLTDEATAIRRNAPHSRPARFLPPPESAGEEPGHNIRPIDNNYGEDDDDVAF